MGSPFSLLDHKHDAPPLHPLAVPLMDPLLPADELAQGLTAREKTNGTNNISTAHLILKESV